MNPLMVRDERERGVDQAADRLSYLVLSFGLLAIVAYRSFAHGEAPWDLLALVVLGGLVGSAYRIQRRAVSGRWALVLGLTAAVALALAAVVAVATQT
jgi:FtsH-binding integral membrane protein